MCGTKVLLCSKDNEEAFYAASAAGTPDEVCSNCASCTGCRPRRTRATPEACTAGNAHTNHSTGQKCTTLHALMQSACNTSNELHVQYNAHAYCSSTTAATAYVTTAKGSTPQGQLQTSPATPQKFKPHSEQDCMAVAMILLNQVYRAGG